MSEFQIRGFETHQHNGRPWYSAQVVTREHRLFVDNRWGSWSCYAEQNRGNGNRPEPGKRGDRIELAPHVAEALAAKCPKRSRRAVA